LSLPISVGMVRALVKEISVSTRSDKPLVVGGARSLVTALRRELGVSGGEEPRGAAVYLHILGGEDDEAALKRARRARVPIVALASEEVDTVPYVLATDVVRLRPGQGFPIDTLTRVIAGRLGEDAAPLAARVPVLRRAVGEQLVASFARKNAVIAAAVFIPGVDLPILVRNQIRMVLRLEQAYGLDPDPRERIPEIAATIAVGFGFRAVARELLDLVPVAGWAVRGAVAYAGTSALGQAALIRLQASGAPGGH
jgi:uncharacterized protein (DUF697 family)